MSLIRIESGQGFELVQHIDYYVSRITQPRYKAMFVVNVHQAKTQLSRLLARVEAGEDVVIACRGEPVARLVGCKPQADILKGKVVIRDSFFDPLPEEELAAWEGH